PPPPPPVPLPPPPPPPPPVPLPPPPPPPPPVPLPPPPPPPPPVPLPPPPPEPPGTKPLPFHSPPEQPPERPDQKPEKQRAFGLQFDSKLVAELGEGPNRLLDLHRVELRPSEHDQIVAAADDPLGRARVGPPAPARGRIQPRVVVCPVPDHRGRFPCQVGHHQNPLVTRGDGPPGLRVHDLDEVVILRPVEPRLLRALARERGRDLRQAVVIVGVDPKRPLQPPPGARELRPRLPAEASGAERRMLRRLFRLPQPLADVEAKRRGGQQDR